MSVLAELEKLHSAEDFFSYLKVDFDPAVVSVARLHILKRMGKYLAGKDFSGASEEEVFASAHDVALGLSRLRRFPADRRARLQGTPGARSGTSGGNRGGQP